MPWYFPWSESIKKRACRYLLQHYLGRFLETKIGLDQLSVDLYNGTGCVKDVSLDVEALNDLSEEQGFPVEFLDGSIAEVSVSVPWSALLSDSSFVEIKGLCLVVHPRQQNKHAFMWESMINSMIMTTSMQLAEECLKHNEGESSDESQNTTFEGLELFAQALETVLCRVKVRFIDTIIRLEYVPQSSLSGVGVEIHVKKIDYYDLAGVDQGNSQHGDQSVNEKSAYATKKFTLEGVTVLSDEFLATDKTESRSCVSSVGESLMTSGSSLDPGRTSGSPVDSLIFCGKLTGRHEVTMRLKQCESLPGPKMELDVTLGSANVFLSPRQLHSFHAIFQSLIQPVAEITIKNKRNEKPMQPADYRRIESELQQQIRQSSFPNLQGETLSRKGWSTGYLDDSDDEFHPFENVRPTERIEGSPDSQGDEHYRVESPLNRSQPKVTRKTSNIYESAEDNPASCRMRFSLKLGSLAALLLHEDVLACNPTSGQLAASTVQQMRSMSEDFFSQLGLLSLTGAGMKDLSIAKEKLDAVCSMSHLRIILAGFNLRGSEHDSGSGTTLEMYLTVAVADLEECLTEKKPPPAGISKFERCPLITFLPQSEGGQVKPNLHVKVVSHQPGRMHQKVRNPVKPELHINVQLTPCDMEVDMSIVDRITALLNRPSFLNSPKAKFSQMYQDKQPRVDVVLDDDISCQTHLSVASPKLNLKLRFPIPDLRPVYDMQRTPWWRRNIRPDILTVAMHEALITTTLVPNETVTTYNLVCKEARCLYQEEAGREALTFLVATAQEGDCVNMADGAGHYDLPRIVLTVRPAQDSNSQLEDQEEASPESEEEDTDVMTLSTGEALMELAPAQPSPFSKQRRIHKGQNHRDESSNVDELLIPGSSEEMAEFTAIAAKKCPRQIDISLPKATVVLPSQNFFEILYNRISTDLCLWEPSAPEYCASTHSQTFHDPHKPSSYGGLGSAVLQSPIQGTFIMCKSGIAYESDSESDDGESGNFSYMKNQHEKWKAKKTNKDCPSKMCISVNIGKGSGTLFCYLKDSPGNTSATHHGEVQFAIDDGRLFTVTAFKGDPNTGYVCFQAAKAVLSHNGYVLNAYDDVSGNSSAKMHQTSRVDQVIYPSETVLGNEKGEAGPMVSLALKIHVDPRLDVKTFKTAISVQGGTLRHRFTPSAHSWFSQITDFFDVVDYPIAGYRPPTVITELHLNLSNCGVDYRPLYLPARVFISLGTMNVSSNIIAQTSSSVLRFVIEDAALHLSNRVSFGTVNLQRDYVCVLDIDLLELSLRLKTPKASASGGANEKTTPAQTNLGTLFELQSSLNMVRLRTCADSCQLLLDLVSYLADDGDYDEKGVALSEDSSESSHNARTRLGSIASVSSMHGPEVESQVNDLMAEAMQDTSSNTVPQQQKVPPKVESFSSPSTQVFFFPDENRTPSAAKVRPSGDAYSEEKGCEGEPCGVWHDGVDQELMDDALDPTCDDLPQPEEEFCILENDPGVGFTPRGGEPQIRVLTSGSVQLVEGHFSPPIGKTDVLKAPKHFPVPVMRYTLREMTLIWEIFGGNDFPKNETSSNPSKMKYQRTVTFSKSNDSQEKVKIRPIIRSPTTSPSSGGRGRKSHHEAGGCNRQHDVKMELQLNKVRFVHEVYPEDTFQASRQVLVVGDIEIRDRLAESHINKFLYQYCSEARPRQAHANMILIKALHVRPDLHLPALECCLKVSILPLRLHIDQDTLTFINEFSSALAEAGSQHLDDEESKAANASSSQAPVMGVGSGVAGEFHPGSNIPDYVSNADSTEFAPSPPIYFRSFVFSPDVLIRFDYHGKGVIDLSQGPSLSGLLEGLIQINCSQLTLKRLSHRHGLLGAQKLVAYALNEWITDIRKNQLPSVMAGVGPMHSIVQLVQGIRDLFWLPIEQFQKDGRIVRGLQRGANAFSTSAALAILELTSRMVQTLQSAAETAYDVVSPGPSVKRSSRAGSRGRRRRHAAQPVDIRDGVAKAYQVVREGLGETAQTFVRVANEEAEQKGMTGAVGGVLRQIPPIVVKPIILATEATVSVIGGVQSQLQPDTRREAIDKWRQDD